ncbi:MAG: SRPBCC family protein [Cyanobacteria bacterium REEB65]|nr:SRPBCC family protein [Cyanobacteria bacterium REEB65]
MIGLLALAAFAPPAWPLTPAAVATLESGKYQVHDFALGEARGAIVRFWVPAPRRQCYQILADSRRMPDYMPGLAAVTIVSASDDTEVLRYHSSYPLIGDFVLERHYYPHRRITWTKIKAPYKRIDGEWDLLPEPGGTVLSYSVALETGMVLVPSWAALALQSQGLPQLVQNVTRRIESGGTWVRPGLARPLSPATSSKQTLSDIPFLWSKT